MARMRNLDKAMRVAVAANKYSVGALAVLALWALALLTFADVFGRDVFDAPVSGAYELTEILVAILIFGALPSLTLGREHVFVDLFDKLFPPTIRPALKVVLTVVEATILALIAWRTWIQANAFLEYNEVTAQLRIPVYFVVLFISLCSALSALLCLFCIFLPERSEAEGGV